MDIPLVWRPLRGPGDDLLPVVTLRALTQDIDESRVPWAREVVRPPSEGLELGSARILPNLNAMTFTKAQGLAVTRTGCEDSAALLMGLA